MKNRRVFLFLLFAITVILAVFSGCNGIADYYNAQKDANTPVQTQSKVDAEIDEFLSKTAGLVSDASWSLGRSFDELKEYWNEVELLDLGDDLAGIIGYPDIVTRTLFLFTNGKVSAVIYSFGNYHPDYELVLKLAYIDKFGSPLESTARGTYWVNGSVGFALAKEEDHNAESGYILSLICVRRQRY
jgi:hypothetical protein